jgi:hypothetical protein
LVHSGVVSWRDDPFAHGSGVGISLPGGLVESGSVGHTFARFTEPGTWTITAISMFDAVGNFVSLTTADVAALGYPTAFRLIAEQQAQVGPPTNKDQCKKGGWMSFNIPRAFKNQGDCIQFVNTGK